MPNRYVLLLDVTAEEWESIRHQGGTLAQKAANQRPLQDSIHGDLQKYRCDWLPTLHQRPADPLCPERAATIVVI